MFQFPAFASFNYGFIKRYLLRGGLPHSDTRGSKIALISPRLFAKCCVLHRLLVPRHPPNALVFLFIQYVYTNLIRINTSNTISLHAPFTAQVKYGFFRISIKLFSRLPGANARCFISAYVTFKVTQTFSSFLKTSKNHIFIQFFVRSYSLCLISPLPYSESKPCSPRYLTLSWWR